MLPVQFWASTPREIWLVIEGARWRGEEGYRLALFGAWHSALFERNRHLPDLMRLLEPTRKQTPEEQLAAVKAWHIALGGDPRELRRLI